MLREGKNVGVYTVAVIEGSSELGLSYNEFQRLTESEKETLVEKTANPFYSAGADKCILNFTELMPLAL